MHMELLTSKILLSHVQGHRTGQPNQATAQAINFHIKSLLIKTHGRMSMSAAKKDVQHTSVLFAGTTKWLILTPHVSTITVPIYTKFMPFIYTTSHTKCEENQFSSLPHICSIKLPNFLHIFLLYLVLHAILEY